jgi:carbonic anhydrase
MIVRFRLAAAVAMVIGAALTAAGSDDAGRSYTPAEALGMLKAGNDRFARNASMPPSLSVNRRQELVAGQRPTAMVLSCADSRLPPEYLFNAGLGDLFVIRTAGQVIDKSILATLEYGADQLHVPLLVVMGHESCDVVTSADTAKGDAASPSMTYLLKAIRSARRQPKQERDDIKGLILANVEQVINDAMAGSSALQRLVGTGQLGVVGAYYDLATGRVTFSEMVHPEGTPSRQERR